MSDNPGATTKLDSARKVKDWSEEHHPDTWQHERLCDIVENNTGYGGEMWWHMRESLRNEFERICPKWWQNMDESTGALEQHWVFVSKLDPKRIGYTPTNEYGRADRQVVTTVGKYLAKHCPEIPELDRRDIADQHRLAYGTNEVRFAFGADDIEAVYVNGPRSCMNNEESYPLRRLIEHPTRIYDGPDTALAYLAKTETSFSARCLVRLDKTPMTFGRIYGDASVLQPRLQALGFRQNSSPYGVRLRLVEDASHSTPLCPYVDAADFVRNENDEWLIPGDEGEYTCSNTNGFCSEHDNNENGQYCPSCEESYDEDEEGGITYNDEWVCMGCLDNYYVYGYGNRNNNESYFRSEDSVYVDDVYYLDSERVLDWHNITFSAVDDEYVNKDDATYLAYKDEYTTRDCVEDHNGNWILQDDAITVGDYVFEKNDPPDEVECVNGEWRLVEDENEIPPAPEHNPDQLLLIKEPA